MCHIVNNVKMFYGHDAIFEKNLKYIFHDNLCNVININGFAFVSLFRNKFTLRKEKRCHLHKVKCALLDHKV